MKRLFVALVVVALAATGYAITVNPASNVTADSEATAFTIPYRDASGNFSVGTLTGGVLAVGANDVVTSSAATSSASLSIDGAYTTAEIQAKTPVRAGMLVYNATLNNLCISTGTTIQGYKLAGTATTTCQ